MGFVPRTTLAVLVIGMGRVLSVEGQTAAPLRLERTIELPDVQGRIDHLTIDLETGRLFMAALGNDTVEVIDLKAGQRLQSMRGFAEPQGILFVPELRRLFVANGKDGSLRVFDAASLGPLKPVSFGADADNVRRDPATGHIWVGYGEGALGAIDASGAKVADIPLGAHPESFQLEHAGSRIFVNLPDSRRIAVVDRKKSAVIARWRTGDASANFPMALDEANKRLFVVCRAPARLLVLNTDSGAIVAALPTAGDADDIFYDQAAKRLYVSGGEGAIAVYQQDDADHYRQTARIETVKGARTSFFSPELHRLFLAVRREGQTPAGLRVYQVAK
jgi:DNA-binding beta-propeller fold protein YncE